ncbi:MAG: response regulator [Gemmatimonadaceae bacterium]
MEPGASEENERPDTLRIVNAEPAILPRVLLVDDEPTIRAAMRRFFSRLGWSVDEAPSGAVALEKLLTANDAEPYRLVICDIRMPGINGIDLHHRLAKVRPEILDRLIFSTGDVVSEEVAEFIETTHCLVLQKPFEFSTLLETVQLVNKRNDRTASGSG